MNNQDLFIQAFIYLAAAVIAVPLAKRFGLGSVLGYLLAGIAIGPFGIGLIGAEGEDVLHFAEFGVVLLLFVIGLELEPALLWRMRGPILGLGGLQVVVTALVIAGLTLLSGLSWQAALAIGMILSLSSTAIVLQTLNEKNLLPTNAGQSSFAVLLFQDIAVIPILAIFPLLASGADTHAQNLEHGGETASHESATTLVSGLPPWLQTLAVIGAVAVVILAGIYLVRPALRIIAQTRLRELFTAAALLLVIGIALLMTQVGLSPALGTFLAGVVLAGSEYRHELESDIDPFRGLLMGLFFIAVGASVDFALIAVQPLLIAGLVFALMAIKFGILFGLSRVFQLSLDQGLIFAFALAQGGEFAFVLLSSASQQGVLASETTSMLTAAVAISMVLTPLLMIVNERLVQPNVGTREADKRPSDAIEEANPVIIAGFDDFGNVIGRMLRANNIGTTVLDNDSDRVEVLRKLGIKVYYGDSTRHDLLHSAGAEKAKIIIIGIDNPEQALGLVHTVRKHFPHLTILARAKDRFTAYDLIKAGVTYPYRETFDTSVRVGIDAMKLLGVRAYQAQRIAYSFTRYDEEALPELAALYDDRTAYRNRARQRIADLQHYLQAHLNRSSEVLERDAAWDTASLMLDVLQQARAAEPPGQSSPRQPMADG
ncbi:MAG: potassium transporter [Chloroflexaceae bacterium]|nr:potassium transporter [Chloroflexaceae bacterium]